MGAKNIFRKIWLGIKIAEPYLSMAGALLPPPFGTILVALDALIDRAELTFPAEGSGVQKAEFFTVQGLKVAEILSGKNVDNPKTRVIVDRIGTISVQIKNFKAQVQQLEQEYKDIVDELKDAIDSVKEPAKSDTTAA
jgi:hypothetical protein